MDTYKQCVKSWMGTTKSDWRSLKVAVRNVTIIFAFRGSIDVEEGFVGAIILFRNAERARGTGCLLIRMKRNA